MRKTMPLEDFRDEGYLQEANRRFFHPLGLALAVDVDRQTVCVFDERDDPEGVVFGSWSDEDRAKAERVTLEEGRRTSARVGGLGFWTEPVGGV